MKSERDGTRLAKSGLNVVQNIPTRSVPEN